jgi:hypothetical protein
MGNKLAPHLSDIYVSGTMSISFDAIEFLGIFESYNMAIWPAQIVEYFLAIIVFILVIGKLIPTPYPRPTPHFILRDL